jgi:hypothetical protein
MNGNAAHVKTLSVSDEIRETRSYQVAAIVFILLSYSVYLFFSEEVVNSVGDEDGVFEYLTALLFLLSSIFFLRSFILNRNVFFILLSIIFFLGFGEEISWGQRIFNLSTPGYFEKHNVQNELTLHNLEVFNAKDFDNTLKGGVKKLLTINFLYNLFWFGFGIILPLTVMFLGFAKKLTSRFNLPVPPLTIGLFFLVNWLFFRIGKSFFLADGRSLQYYDTIGEIQECGSSFIFFLLSVYFFTKTKSEERIA